MRTLDVLDLEDFPFDEPLGPLMGKEIDEALAYSDDDEDDQELGYRSLFERPEALSPTLRRHLH